jgi:hypothetical protein
MKLIQDFPGYNWRTDDPARLHISRTGHLTEAPLVLKCFVMHDSLNLPFSRGESQPSNKSLLFASLHIDLNHP